MSWVLNPDRVGILCRLAGSELQTGGATKLNERNRQRSRATKNRQRSRATKNVKVAAIQADVGRR